MSNLLNSETVNNTFISFLEIKREDECGIYSLYEIGFRTLPSHANYNENNNFQYINLSLRPLQEGWKIAIKLFKKGKTPQEISEILEFISEKKFLQPKAKILS